MHKISLALILVSIAACFGVGPAHADVRDLGEVCISFFYDHQLGIPPQIDRFGVLVFGESRQHILLTGVFNPAHGSALVTADKILVTLHSSFVSADSLIKGYGTTHMVIS